MSDLSEVDIEVRRALEAWAVFPATRDPRPIVLLGEPTRSGSFPDAAKKKAFLNGSVVAASPEFPADVLQMLRRHSNRPRVPPLTATSATLSSTQFHTDRGLQQLSAWEVRTQDVDDSIWVLDSAVFGSCWWPTGPKVPHWRGRTARHPPTA